LWAPSWAPSWAFPPNAARQRGPIGRSTGRRRGHRIPLGSERRSGAPLASQSTRRSPVGRQDAVVSTCMLASKSTRRSPERGAPPNGTKGGNGRPTAAAPVGRQDAVLSTCMLAGRTKGGNGRPTAAAPVGRQDAVLSTCMLAGRTKGGNGRPTAAAPATRATSSRNLVLQLAGSAGAQMTSGGNGGRARRRTNRSYLIREALRSHQRSSEVIRGHQRSSEVIRGHQKPSEVIRGHQRSSEAIRGHYQRQSPSAGVESEAIRGHQRSSEATIRGNHRRPEWRAASSSVYPIAPSPETSHDAKSRSLSSSVTSSSRWHRAR
jgi:hypothetical protein